jgi:hypothetical protein
VERSPPRPAYIERDQQRLSNDMGDVYETMIEEEKASHEDGIMRPADIVPYFKRVLNLDGDRKDECEDCVIHEDEAKIIEERTAKLISTEGLTDPTLKIFLGYIARGDSFHFVMDLNNHMRGYREKRAQGLIEGKGEL